MFGRSHHPGETTYVVSRLYPSKETLVFEARSRQGDDLHSPAQVGRTWLAHVRGRRTHAEPTCYREPCNGAPAAPRSHRSAARQAATTDVSALPRDACENNMLVRRRLAEKAILGALTAQLTQTQQIHHVIERVGAEIAKLSEHLPETIRAKESELGSEERRLASFVDFIGEGRGSQALANALVETERRVEALREELEALSRSRRRVFRRHPWSGSRSA